MEEYVTDNIYVLGDTHSLAFEYLFRHYKLENFILIHVGDVGAGFDHVMTENKSLHHIDKYCAEHNGKVFITRGNHDDPTIWDLNHSHNKLFPNIEFVPDYTYKKINGKTFLFVGGAISIDRKFRVQGRDYWKDEIFVLPKDYTTLPPCDVLITHTSGSHQFPYGGLAKIQDFFIKDVHLEGELIEERNQMTKLYYQVQPRLGHYYGHFHQPFSEYINGTNWRCLDINEVADITNIVK